MDEVIEELESANSQVVEDRQRVLQLNEFEKSILDMNHRAMEFIKNKQNAESLSCLLATE
jgi:hypothetical protein